MSEQTEAPPHTPAQRVILASLARRNARILKLRAQLQEQYDGRLSDWAKGRAISPPILVRDLCAAAGVTEEAYRERLRKAKNAQSNGG